MTDLHEAITGGLRDLSPAGTAEGFITLPPIDEDAVYPGSYTEEDEAKDAAAFRAERERAELRDLAEIKRKLRSMSLVCDARGWYVMHAILGDALKDSDRVAKEYYSL